MSNEEKSLEQSQKSPAKQSGQLVHDDVDLIKNYLTTAFIKKHTCFSDLETFLNSGGFTAKTKPEFHSIPVDALDALVLKNSRYSTWSEMVSAAGDYYFENQMKEIKFKNI
ncbi:hypothetical protein [Acetobacterium sp.]|uniref:hypothetical protein n=1 Tax=Acetobacterium sp. TaxID=1872094 RepID=UPI002F41EAF2